MTSHRHEKSGEKTEEVTHMRTKSRWLVFVFVMALVAAACTSSDTDDTTTTQAPETTTTTTLGTTTSEAPPTTEAPTTTEAPPPPEPEGRSLDAPVAAITVDGDPSDWDIIPGLALTLEPIVDRADDNLENMDVTIKMAHDDEFVYSLFTVVDDYDYNPDDPHFSASPSWMFPVDTGGPHMGADDELGENTTGMVDIWHWELECLGDVPQGGVNPPGDGKDPGNDSLCNYDDEWATDAETREDDNLEGAENSLLGHWMHTNPIVGEPGVWYFETSRPLQTGDAVDAQFTAGESTMLALAYWDADFGPDGWDDSTHVQSSNQGWINVNLG